MSIMLSYYEAETSQRPGGTYIANSEFAYTGTQFNLRKADDRMLYSHFPLKSSIPAQAMLSGILINYSLTVRSQLSLECNKHLLQPEYIHLWRCLPFSQCSSQWDLKQAYTKINPVLTVITRIHVRTCLIL